MNKEKNRLREKIRKVSNKKILRNLKSEAELKKLEFANCDERFPREDILKNQTINIYSRSASTHTATKDFIEIQNAKIFHYDKCFYVTSC